MPISAWIEDPAQVEFVVHGNSILADRRNGRLQFACLIDGTRPHLHETKAPPQVKLQSGQIGIGRGQPQPRTTLGPKLGGERFDQSSPYTSAGRHSVD